MQKKLMEIVSSTNIGYDYQMMADNLTRSLVSSSVSHGYNSKEEWKELSKEEDGETAEIIDGILARTKGKGGRKADF